MKLTLDSFKKAAKRHADQTGKPLSTAQEELAVLLGFSNFHTVVRRMGPQAQAPLQMHKSPSPHSSTDRLSKTQIISISVITLFVVGFSAQSFFTPASSSLWGSGSQPLRSTPRDTDTPPNTDQPTPKSPEAFKQSGYFSVEPQGSLDEARVILMRACETPCKLLLDQSSLYRSSTSFILPNKQKAAFIRSVESLGLVSSRNYKTENISAPVADSKAHQDNLVAYRDKLRELLTQTVAPETLFQIHKELQATQSKLDAASAVGRELDQQAQMTIIDVDITKAAPSTPFSDLLVDAKKSFLASLFILIYGLTFLAPFVAVAVCFAWIFAPYVLRFKRAWAEHTGSVPTPEVVTPPLAPQPTTLLPKDSLPPK